ncbi:hypothetical protein TNCV_1067851 [Trichonephila clavipes]|nr:hypothetical protein TNCV_1067851 [Trichonephila clavipes]
MGALLAARLAKEISRVLNEKISTTNYFWTDSTIALSWIQGPSNRWKVFVANRVKEIRSLTEKRFMASLCWKGQSIRSSNERHQC